MTIADLLAYLGDPQLVVRFQNLCGVEYLPDDLQLEQPAADGVSRHGNHDATEAASAACGSQQWESDDGVHEPSEVQAARRRRQHEQNRREAPHNENRNACCINNNNNINNVKHTEIADSENEGNTSRALENEHSRVYYDGLSSSPCSASQGCQEHRHASVPASGASPPLPDPLRPTCCPDSLTATADAADPATARTSNGNVAFVARHCQGVSAKAKLGGGSIPGSATMTRATPHCPNVLIRYPALYYLAQIGAFLGNEEFYLTGLPLMLWTVDGAVVRQVTMVWWLVMYLGQATKDYLGWARPPSPPLVRLEFSHLAEFSMPSTHAMAGTAIPLVMASLLLQRYDLPFVPVALVALSWCLTTSLSRLYLGVHTVLDVIAGVSLALVIYLLAYPLMGRADLYQQTSPLAPAALVATSLALCTVCYPSQHKSSARMDAVIITAVLVGVGAGSWLNYQLGYSSLVPPPVQALVSLPSWRWLVNSLLQFPVGMALVLAVKMTVKVLAVRFFSLWHGLERPDPRHPGVMLAYKYTTYCAVGLAITFLDPFVFAALGIDRPAFYMEVI